MVRFKNRYFLVEVVKDQSSRDGSSSSDTTKGAKLRNQSLLNSKEKMLKAVRDSIAIHFGGIGKGLAATQSLNVKHFHAESGTCIIRSTREHANLVWCAITLLGTPGCDGGCSHYFFCRVLHVAGTIRSCSKAALNYHRNHLRHQQYWSSFHAKEVAIIAALEEDEEEDGGDEDAMCVED